MSKYVFKLIGTLSLFVAITGNPANAASAKIAHASPGGSTVGSRDKSGTNECPKNDNNQQMAGNKPQTTCSGCVENPD